jgi:hypothetical protein
VTASAATALQFWRSRCSPSPGFIRRPPRVSGLSPANHEHLGRDDRDYQIMMQSSDALAKNQYDRLSSARVPVECFTRFAG